MYKLTDTDKGIFKTEIDPTQFLDFSLIEIKNNKVNARGLWEFLEIGQEFANWIKYQIQSLDLVENEDFDKIVKPLENNKKEYLLTIDTAKDLAMVTRNEQGQKARNYFKECEKKLRENKPKELSKLEILELAIESEKENQRLKQIVIERAESVPAQTMRITINRVVREYAKSKSLVFSTIWNELYNEFKYLYHIDLKTRAKKGQSKIQIAEDLGKLEDLYNLSLKMFEVDKNLMLK
jgi:phage anti-repressor protein